MQTPRELNELRGGGEQVGVVAVVLVRTVVLSPYVSFCSSTLTVLEVALDLAAAAASRPFDRTHRSIEPVYMPCTILVGTVTSLCVQFLLRIDVLRSYYHNHIHRSLSYWEQTDVARALNAFTSERPSY